MRYESSKQNGSWKKPRSLLGSLGVAAVSMGIMIIVLSSCADSTSVATEALTIEVQGHVTEYSDGSPIEGAEVDLQIVTGWETSDILTSTGTDSSGYYHLRYTFASGTKCGLLQLLVGFNFASTPPFKYDFALVNGPNCAAGVQTIDVKLHKG